MRAVVGTDTDSSVEPAPAVIRRIYDELITDPAAGTITLAIASVATGAAEAPRPSNGSARAAANQGGDVGLVAGAIVGAVIGFGIGGFVGGGIGATVGGIAGAIAGKCAS